MLIFNKNSNLVKILSNYVGKLWSLLAVFLCVPLYINYLGIENYAVIGFYTLVLALISFADAGMSSAITREFSLEESTGYKLSILNKIEKLYWGVLFFICSIIMFFSGIIAEKWLKTEAINLNDLTNYILLIGVGACIQMAASLYYGALFGLGFQVQANNYQIIWTTFKSLLVILLIKFIRNGLYVFFIWQIICNIIYVYSLRSSVLKGLDKKNNNTNYGLKSFEIPKRIYKYIGGMALVAIISSISSQMDKLVISYFYSLKVFGYYTMVSLLAQIPIFITMPIAAFIFPLLSKFAEKKDKKSLFDNTLKKFIFLLYLIIIPTSIFICFYPLEVLQTWSNAKIELHLLSDMVFLVQTLTIGSMFLAMQFPLYYTLLAHSETKYTVYQGAVQLVVGVPLLFCLAKFYGLKYVGITWLLINFCGFIYLLFVCLERFTNIEKLVYLKKYVIPNVCISSILSSISLYIYNNTNLIFFVVALLHILITFMLIIALNNYQEGRRIFSLKHLYNFSKE